MFKKSASLLLIGLLVFSFVAVASADQTQKITGTVLSVNADKGDLTVQDENGVMKTLAAGPDVDLKAFKEGDKVSVESDGDNVIKSISVTK
jgi:hypothetical protein